jgi:hypothetical protein
VIKRECFAFAEDKCSALKALECDGCNFYKSRERAHQDQQKVFRRIKGLHRQARVNIIELYYRGNMKLLDEVEERK